MRTNHRQADTGIATRGFDYGLPGFEGTAALGVFDDPEGQAILNRTHRVERFDLDVDIDIFRAQIINPDCWSVADSIENTLV